MLKGLSIKLAGQDGVAGVVVSHNDQAGADKLTALIDNPAMNIYKRHRFPPDIIKYAVWLYFRFNLSHRDIEDLLAERGVVVSYEAVRVLTS